MATRKLYNRVTLREHPDASPTDDPSFEKGHSYIFPGDEIVMCTKINGPTDLGGSWANIVLQSVKMSVIAKKPNIFSEEFSREFAATRFFTLDSVTVALNGTNAPIVPWGTAGADGYAPNINFTQQRNWALPIADFRRQIIAFTEHTSGTSEWDFNFWFPFIFNEQYWLALAAADNDFFNLLESQNGKNQKWLRYHDLAALPFGWKIFFRFEMQYTISGVPNKLVTELNMSNETDGIGDYESNTDYTLRSIKTCEVGGTPSNTPSPYVFGDRNTSCFGYFTKQTAWETGEKELLTGLFRIRPYLGGDRLGSRASSRYDSNSQVVWVEKSNDLLTDTSLNIDTDTSVNIVIDNAGAGVSIAFDPLDDKNIIVSAEIDYIKLASIFPGVQNFTLYCRIYNGMVLDSVTPPGP